MRWRGERESENVEDRRDVGGGGFGSPFPGGGGLRFPGGGGARGGGIGIVGLLILLGLMFFFGVDPRVIMQGGGPGGTSRTSPTSGCRNRAQTPPVFRFPGSRRVLISSTRAAQARTISSSSSRWCWPKPRTSGATCFRNTERDTAIRSSCCFPAACVRPAASAWRRSGPFYCPLDEKVYIDLSFYTELKDRFDAPGDFAQAYVIAHEVGHHVQKLLGIMDQVDAVQAAGERAASQRHSVRVELQADCFAGVWAQQRAAGARTFSSPATSRSALNAASAIGDDRLQKQTQGYVVPDSFTHGSSAQRVRWFKRGYQTGDLRQCDTFNAEDL